MCTSDVTSSSLAGRISESGLLSEAMTMQIDDEPFTRLKKIVLQGEEWDEQARRIYSIL